MSVDVGGGVSFCTKVGLYLFFLSLPLLERLECQR